MFDGMKEQLPCFLCWRVCREEDKASSDWNRGQIVRGDSCQVNSRQHRVVPVLCRSLHA